MFKNLLLVIVALSLITAGCAREEARQDEYREDVTPTEPPPTQTTPSPNPGEMTPSQTHTPGTVDETNTGMNVRDRDGTTATPLDQSNNEADLQTTARIRQAILDDPALSVTAENVKIITVSGKVTLRGPVMSAAEKAAIVAKAQQIAGTTQVDDQLEIAESSTDPRTGG